MRRDTRVATRRGRAGPLQAVIERVLLEGIVVLNETAKARLKCLAFGSRRQTPRSRRPPIGAQNRKHHNTHRGALRQYPAISGNGKRATGSQARLLTASRFPFPVAGPYLISTCAPSASSLAFTCSASSSTVRLPIASMISSLRNPLPAVFVLVSAISITPLSYESIGSIGYVRFP